MADEYYTEQLSTVIWPGPPKEFSGPSRYTRETISRIPAGSLYFASRKGPFSEMNARITGSPYDMLGIIVWSEAPGREGTYVYVMDPNSGVVVISLDTLITDDTIIHHAILPLKDPLDDEWADQRHQILKELLKKYRSLAPQYDPYQSLASIIGLPVADSLRAKNALTPAELMGLILFQTGLIWDRRNPIYSWNDCFFDAVEDGNVALITPTLYRERMSSPQPRNPPPPPPAPPESESETSSSTEYSEARRPPIRMKTTEPPNNEEKGPIRMRVVDPLRGHKKSPSSSEESGNKNEEKGPIRMRVVDPTRERKKSSSSSAESGNKNEKKGPIRMRVVDPSRGRKKSSSSSSSSSEDSNNKKESSDTSEDFDDIMREDLRSYLRNSFKKGPPRKEEKWRDEKGGDWSDESELGDPIKKVVVSRTIIFGSLRPVDFLANYYLDLDSKQSIRRTRHPSGRRGLHGELMAIVESLADQGIHDINQLDMSWYHDNLIPIDLCNRPEALCQGEVDGEVHNLKLLLCQLDQDFIQKRALHLENSLLSNERLLRICRQTSELAAELHILAGECQTFVRNSKEIKPLGFWDEERSYVRFNIKLSSENEDKHLMILPRYMWGQDWKYDWRSAVRFSIGRFTELFDQLEKLRIRFTDLRNRIPLNCVILELVAHLQENVNSLHKYIQSCYRHRG